MSVEDLPSKYFYHCISGISVNLEFIFFLNLYIGERQREMRATSIVPRASWSPSAFEVLSKTNSNDNIMYRQNCVHSKYEESITFSEHL